jgi:hypothetical protein
MSTIAFKWLLTSAFIIADRNVITWISRLWHNREVQIWLPLPLPLPLRDYQPIKCVSYIRLANQMRTKPVRGSGTQIWSYLIIAVSSLLVSLHWPPDSVFKWASARFFPAVTNLNFYRWPRSERIQCNRMVIGTSSQLCSVYCNQFSKWWPDFH